MVLMQRTISVGSNSCLVEILVKQGDYSWIVENLLINDGPGFVVK